MRAAENAQLQQPQDVTASGTGSGGTDKSAEELAKGGGIKAPVKVQSRIPAQLGQTTAKISLPPALVA